MAQTAPTSDVSTCTAAPGCRAPIFRAPRRAGAGGRAQAQHGAAPDIQGQDKADPTSMILSAGMRLQWLGEHHGNAVFQQAGAAIEAAVDTVLRNPATRTPDLGGTTGTRTGELPLPRRGFARTYYKSTGDISE